METMDHVNTGPHPPVTIGSTSRDGLLIITDTRWDSHGTLFVTVRERVGTGGWVGACPSPRCAAWPDAR